MHVPAHTWSRGAARATARIRTGMEPLPLDAAHAVETLGRGVGRRLAEKPAPSTPTECAPPGPRGPRQGGRPKARAGVLLLRSPARPIHVRLQRARGMHEFYFRPLPAGALACMRNSGICTTHPVDDGFHRWRRGGITPMRTREPTEIERRRRRGQHILTRPH